MGGIRRSRQSRARIIDEFRRCGRVDMACAAAGIERSAHYQWLAKDAEYAAEFELARAQVAGLLEDEAVRRAYRGTLRPVTVAGQQVMVAEFSDRLLEFLLKCRNPKVFGDQSTISNRFVDKAGNDRSLIGELDALVDAAQEIEVSPGTTLMLTHGD